MSVLSRQLEERLTRDAQDDREARDATIAENRNRLRDNTTIQLRDAGTPHAHAPASIEQPSFKVGQAANFPYTVEAGPVDTVRGSMSEQGYSDFMSNMAQAATKRDVYSRDASTQKAAQSVVRDWLDKHMPGHHGKQSAADELKSEVLHKARAQVVFSSREIGEKLGIPQWQSAAVGYSLERALEKEGFRVFANHALDKSVDVFKATASSLAGATGMRADMESKLASSVSWLAEHGVGREALKDAVLKHSGKFQTLVSAAEHPEAITRAAQLISHSDSVLTAVSKIGTDQELRKAVGNLTLSAGEGLAGAPGSKGLASVAIVAGSVMRGDSAEDTSRHAFRAALSILGGAAGGIGGGAVSAGFGSVAGGMVGAELGGRLADKLLDVYDGFTKSNSAAQAQGHDNVHHVSKQEATASAKTIVDKLAHSSEAQAAVRGLEKTMAR